MRFNIIGSKGAGNLGSFDHAVFSLHVSQHKRTVTACSSCPCSGIGTSVGRFFSILFVALDRLPMLREKRYCSLFYSLSTLPFTVYPPFTHCSSSHSTPTQPLITRPTLSTTSSLSYGYSMTILPLHSLIPITHYQPTCPRCPFFLWTPFLSPAT